MGSGLSSFAVPLATLREGVNPLDRIGRPEEAGISGDDAEVVGEIRVSGQLVRSEARVEVQAVVRAKVRQICDRCVQPVETSIEAPIRLVCEKRGGRDVEEASDGRAAEPGLLYHDGRTLDFSDEVREVILLEVPWHPLCSPDCKGLCPRCGEDRNKADCGCPTEKSGSPWNILRTLIEAEGRPSDRSQKEE